MEMIFTAGNPADRASFSSAVAVAAGTRLLYISGQVGRKEDGSIPDSPTEQCAQTWRNIMGILHGQGLNQAHIVRITAYLTSPEYLPAYQASRREALQAHLPASTSLIVAGLVDPRLKVEIDVVAAYPQ